MLMSVLIAACSGAAGCAFAAWRLRGDRTMTEALRAVVTSGGGPRPSKPR